jgi:hypothetical protein
MKKFLSILAMFVIILSLLYPMVIAHSGRTDKRGGHYDKSTGEYHYHHGYPAHQHIDGICPYNHDDKTDHNSGSYSDSRGTSSDDEKIDGWIYRREKTASDYFDLFIRIPFFTLFIFGGACYFMWIVLWIYPEIESEKKLIIIGGTLIASIYPIAFLFGWSASKWIIIVPICYVVIVFLIGLTIRYMKDVF